MCRRGVSGKVFVVRDARLDVKVFVELFVRMEIRAIS